jgi:hypothetical protein
MLSRRKGKNWLRINPNPKQFATEPEILGVSFGRLFGRLADGTAGTARARISLSTASHPVGIDSMILPNMENDPANVGSENGEKTFTGASAASNGSGRPTHGTTPTGSEPDTARINKRINRVLNRARRSTDGFKISELARAAGFSESATLGNPNLLSQMKAIVGEATIVVVTTLNDPALPLC